MEIKINKKENGREIIFEVEGQLNTATAPQFSNEIESVKDQYDSMVFDCTKLDYVSSAGLRVFFATYDAMNKKGGIKLIGVNDFVYEIFEDVGFTEFMSLEKQ